VPNRAKGDPELKKLNGLHGYMEPGSKVAGQTRIKPNQTKSNQIKANQGSKVLPERAGRTAKIGAKLKG
jgi:hypothetical protein